MASEKKETTEGDLLDELVGDLADRMNVSPEAVRQSIGVGEAPPGLPLVEMANYVQADYVRAADIIEHGGPASALMVEQVKLMLEAHPNTPPEFLLGAMAGMSLTIDALEGSRTKLSGEVRDVLWTMHSALLWHFNERSEEMPVAILDRFR